MKKFHLKRPEKIKGFGDRRVRLTKWPKSLVCQEWTGFVLSARVREICYAQTFMKVSQIGSVQLQTTLDAIMSVLMYFLNYTSMKISPKHLKQRNVINKD